jgi:hypothetical protein
MNLLGISRVLQLTGLARMSWVTDFRWFCVGSTFSFLRKAFCALSRSTLRRQ